MKFSRDFSLNGKFYKKGDLADGLDKKTIQVLLQRGVLVQNKENKKDKKDSKWI